MQCRVEERVACVARPQKAQQEKRPAHFLQRKAQEHNDVQGMSLKGIALEERGWRTKGEIVMFVECGRCKYKSTRTEENQGQGFISGKQLRNLWCGSCLEAWKLRKDGEECKVEYVKCGRNDMIKGRKLEEGKILCPECMTGRKKL